MLSAPTDMSLRREDRIHTMTYVNLLKMYRAWEEWKWLVIERFKSEEGWVFVDDKLKNNI